MLVNVKYERGQDWTVDENAALMIPELRDLLVDVKFGVKAVAFVALYADPDSLYVKSVEDESDRQTEVAKSIFGEVPSALLKSKKLQAAIDRYERLSQTSLVKLRNQYQKGVVKVGEYIENNQDSLKDTNVRDFVDNLGKLPTLISGYTDMQDGKREDVERVKAVITGKRELSYRETKKRKKR